MAAEDLLIQIGHVLTSVQGAITLLNTLLSAPSLREIVPLYNGEENGFRDWIESVIKYSDVNNLDPAQRIDVAYVTCSGRVSDFIRKWKEDHVTGNWEDLKLQLVLRFSETNVGEVDMTQID